MTAQITPGPWKLDRAAKHPWKVLCPTNIPGSFGLVCEVGYRPNAQAITAVPAMVEALVQYRDDLLRPPEGDSRQRRLERVNEVLKLAGISTDCPGHVASDDDRTRCRHCGASSFEDAPEPEEGP